MTTEAHALRAERGHLCDPLNLPELALQRSSDRSSHGFGDGALQRRIHLNGRKIDLRQGSDRQKRESDKSDKCDRRHQR
jgi:hypothetical protein